MKKGRTFSFDLPKLKLGAFKYENRPWNDANAMVMEPESPGEVPKSVRPLPNDLEAALRAACTGVLRNNKPSHEYHKGGKAQLDYATIRRGGGNQPAPRKPEPIPTTLSKSTSNEDRAQHPHRESTMMNGGMIPGMSHRMSTMPAVMPATFEPQAHAQAQESNYQVQLQRSRAQSRADQLMAGPPVESQQVQRTRTNSQHSRSQSTPQGFWTAPSPQLISKFGSLRRPKPAPRAQSMETTPAPLHDSAKEYPWSTSPTKATATEQPPQPSHAAPAPPSEGKKENASPVDADWMHDDSERRRLLRQQEFAETALSRHTTWIAPKPEPAQEKQTEKEQEAEKEEEKKTATEQESRTPTLVTKIPERKPVPTAQAVASPMSTSSLSSPTIEFPDEVLRSPSQQSAAVEDFQRVPTMQRSESRNGRERMRGNGVPMNSRAASRARSVTRDVKNFIRNASRNASRTRQPNMRSDDASTRSRSRRPSFSREVANNVKEYFRPGTAVDKQSLDVPRNIANLKSKSHESFVSARSDASPAKDTPMQLSQRSSQHNKNPSGSTGRNSFEVGEESITPRNAAGSEAPQQKRQPDLNRALPPLPRLDSWHVESFIAPSNDAPESPQSALRPPKDPQEPSLPSPTSSTTMKRISSRDSRSPLPSPKIGGVHDFVALRMGAPVSRQASKAKIPHEHGNPNLTHQQKQRSPRPPMSRRAPTDPKDVRTKTPDHGRPSSQVREKEYQASRRRSKSVQEVNAPDLSEKLRQASANSPDGRPIHAVGQAKLINTTPSRDKLDGFASKIGRKLSTKRRNITPTQNPPVPPPHRELPQRTVKTATSTPDGLSRANSTYHAKRRPDMSRKMSMEESGRPHDGRSFKNNDELMMPPPPVAVGSSKNSPRMGLGNFLPNKFQQQTQSMPQTPQQQQHQQHAQQQSVSKKWWHLGLGNGNDNMDAGSKGGSGMEQTSGGLGVRY